MRVPALPASMIVVGGGFIAAELSHAFQAFGVDLTIVQRGDRLLPGEDEQIARRFTELAAARYRVLLDASVVAVAPAGAGVRVTVERARGHVEHVEAETLLLATGRRPNTDHLDLAACGLELDGHGHVITDDRYRTSVPGVWSLGDATNHFQLKHRANAEARAVAHDLVRPEDPPTRAHPVTPHAVFSEPQIASAGLTEGAAREAGIECLIAVRPFADTAYGWALEEDSGFVKLIADARDRNLVGAHVIGPQAPLLLQPLVQGMALGQTVDQIARDVLYIHPALTEVVELALLDL
jgi:mycothione reductase